MQTPKLFTTLKDYRKSDFFSDCGAGVIVGIVAIPLAIAFAIASGVSPEKGLVTAIVAGFLVSTLGGSRVQIGGPTAAFVVIVYGIVQKYGTDGLILATLMAGVLLVVMGWAKFGTAVKFIPHSVIVGFTSGIAVVIFSSQIKDFFGFSTGILPAGFFDKWRTYFLCFRSFNADAAVIGALSILIIALWPRFLRKVPGSFVAMILTSVIVSVFHLPVETIGSHFGALPTGLPHPVLPALDLAKFESLLQPAFTIALLGAVESLLSAVVSDGMIGGHHRPNVELMAQGLANIGSALFGGIPATGAIARTVTNIKSGGRTPVAGIVHALTILLILLFFGAWIRQVPLACLAGILMVVAYHMSEWRSFTDLLKGSRGAMLVLLSTFTVTVLVDLSVAIELGMVLSSFVFIRRMADFTNVNILAREIQEDEEEKEAPIRRLPIPKGVDVYEINGPLFFGAANKFEEAMRVVASMPRVRILRLRYVPLMDSSGLEALKSFYRKCQAAHVRLLVAGLHAQPLNEMVKSNLYDLIGEENVFATLKEALDHAEHLVKAPHT